MAQGNGYLKKGKKGVKNVGSKPSKKAVSYSHKKSATKFTKKGSTLHGQKYLSLNPLRFTNVLPMCRPDDGDSSRLQRHEEPRQQGRHGFHQPEPGEYYGQSRAAGRDNAALSDVKAHGKERLKEINQHARTKKKSRVAQKLAALERSIKDQEEGGTKRKRPTAAAVVSQS
ncbi:hypothetical protein GQ600_10904 [Phytophthora cactorum]|nr:hypothetical protein GQ600_10904 [Phytophthora cactorum]